jgi:hypothetical protein
MKWKKKKKKRKDFSHFRNRFQTFTILSHTSITFPLPLLLPPSPFPPSLTPLASLRRPMHERPTSTIAGKYGVQLTSQMIVRCSTVVVGGETEGEKIHGCIKYGENKG